MLQRIVGKKKEANEQEGESCSHPVGVVLRERRDTYKKNGEGRVT